MIALSGARLLKRALICMFSFYSPFFPYLGLVSGLATNRTLNKPQIPTQFPGGQTDPMKDFGLALSTTTCTLRKAFFSYPSYPGELCFVPGNCSSKVRVATAPCHLFGFFLFSRPTCILKTDILKKKVELSCGSRGLPEPRPHFRQ